MNKLTVAEYEAIVPVHQGAYMDGFFTLNVPDLKIFEKPLEMKYYQPAQCMHANTMVYDRENLIAMTPYFEIVVAVQTPYSKN